MKKPVSFRLLSLNLNSSLWIKRFAKPTTVCALNVLFEVDAGVVLILSNILIEGPLDESAGVPIQIKNFSKSLQIIVNYSL